MTECDKLQQHAHVDSKKQRAHLTLQLITVVVGGCSLNKII